MVKIVTTLTAVLAVTLIYYLNTINYQEKPDEVESIDFTTEDEQKQLSSSSDSLPLTINMPVRPQESKDTETKSLEELTNSESFTIKEGDTEIINAAPLSRLNDLDKFDAFGQKLSEENETRSEKSVYEELRLKEFLQEKVPTFKNSPVSRIYCAERYCLFVSTVNKDDELFLDFMRMSKKNEFGSGGFFNFESNGEKFNSVIISLQPGQSVAL